jgi:DNA-binding NarL/FixJ family response regulator
MIHDSLIRVLLVDSHAYVREGLRVALKDERSLQVVGEASDAHEALIEARRLHPHVVVMDLEMTGTDGIVTTKLMTTHDASVQVLLLSAYNDDERIDAAMRANATAYVFKRIGTKELARLIIALQRGETVDSTYLARVRQPPFRYPPIHSGIAPLTRRELELLEHLVRGRCNKEISNLMSISLDTVKAHLKHIYNKLEVESRTQAVVQAIRRQLVA